MLDGSNVSRDGLHRCFLQKYARLALNGVLGP